MSHIFILLFLSFSFLQAASDPIPEFTNKDHAMRWLKVHSHDPDIDLTAVREAFAKFNWCYSESPFWTLGDELRKEGFDPFSGKGDFSSIFTKITYAQWASMMNWDGALEGLTSPHCQITELKIPGRIYYGWQDYHDAYAWNWVGLSKNKNVRYCTQYANGHKTRVLCFASITFWDAFSLWNNQHLQSLELPYNKFTGQNLQSIFQDLKKITTFLRLNLSHSSFLAPLEKVRKRPKNYPYVESPTGDAFGPLVANLITSSQTLTDLDLSYLKMGEKGMLSLIEALGRSKIQRLNLAGNRLSPRVIDAFIALLESGKTFEYLSLKGCRWEGMWPRYRMLNRLTEASAGKVEQLEITRHVFIDFNQQTAIKAFSTDSISVIVLLLMMWQFIGFII